MNHCYSCTTCKSADKPLECYIAGLPMETSHHRVEGQSVKCGFGLQGVCCRLCSNGPCRITPEAPHGICGASADVIVARNFLRAVAAGSGCYIHVVETTALNLKETALSGGALKGMNGWNISASYSQSPRATHTPAPQPWPRQSWTIYTFPTTLP